MTKEELYTAIQEQGYTEPENLLPIWRRTQLEPLSIFCGLLMPNRQKRHGRKSKSFMTSLCISVCSMMILLYAA